MPKHTITFESEDKIPAELKPFANGLTVSGWFNTDDMKVAAETNPALEANRNQILIEKRALETENSALKQVATDDSIDKAKLIVERDALRQTAIPAEESELLTTIKQVFSGVPLSEVKTKLPALIDDSKFAEQTRKEQSLESVFQASGFKNKQVFLDLVTNPAKMKGIEGELLVEPVTGSDQKKVFVNVKDANGVTAKKPFDEFVNTSDDWKPYIPALTNGDVKENQTWIPANPNLDGKTAPKENAVTKAIQTHNEKAQSARNPFAPEYVPPKPAEQTAK